MLKLENVTHEVWEAWDPVGAAAVLTALPKAAGDGKGREGRTKMSKIHLDAPCQEGTGRGARRCHDGVSSILLPLPR